MENPLDKYFQKQLTLRISVGNLLFVVTGLLGLFYLAWEIYWYNRVGLTFVKWHTHLFVYYLLFWVLAVLGKLTRRKNVFGALTIFFAVFFLIEVVLMFGDGQKNHHEKKYAMYVSPYVTSQTTNYHTWNTNSSSHRLMSGEFDYWRPTNRLGFSDEEWKPPSETPGRHRILALGDSFTEGDGASFDSSYVAFLKRYLLADGDSSYVMNGGICGSDPFENFMNLEHLLKEQKSDYIIQTLSTNDLYTDIAVKGGFTRFGANTQTYESGPWWEPVYAVSYVSRFFFKIMGYSSMLVNEKDPRLNEKLNARLVELFDRYIPFCRKHNITLLLVLLPNAEEVEDEKIRFDFEPMKRLLAHEKGVYVRDLLPYYVAQKKASPQGIEPYYWPIDRHHNGKGYALMASAIYTHLKPILALPETR